MRIYIEFEKSWKRKYIHSLPFHIILEIPADTIGKKNELNKVWEVKHTVFMHGTMGIMYTLKIQRNLELLIRNNKWI